MKTILQSYRGTDARPTIASLAAPSNFRTLTRGAGANFLLSVPHGAVNFAVLEFVRSKMSQIVESNPTLSKNAEKFGAGLDFLSSAISTICCSVVSTPQMMITDNIMAGNYPNLPAAAKGLAKTQGIAGFYTGWWPGLAGKIPSYALTWTLFQQLRAAHSRICDRPPTDIENSIMGCIASATTVTIMIPMDTIKTRLVTQASMAARGADIVPYKGIVDCALRIAREEGINVFYRGLPPRLVSVVPMIGIQFGVYEFMKKVMLNRSSHKVILKGKMKMEPPLEDPYGRKQALEEALMEVAASPEQPFPAPHFRDRYQSLKEIFTPEKKQKKSSAK
jgi:solute carrier family 25 S-adenosylmethionine transporter 26